MLFSGVPRVIFCRHPPPFAAGRTAPSARRRQPLVLCARRSHSTPLAGQQTTVKLPMRGQRYFRPANGKPGLPPLTSVVESSVCCPHKLLACTPVRVHLPSTRLSVRPPPPVHKTLNVQPAMAFHLSSTAPSRPYLYSPAAAELLVPPSPFFAFLPSGQCVLLPCSSRQQ
ncbi:hypothetical protein BD413DRAFT_97797 [Trametes elegans]|nr:hypothetical protein BD413DRAFT_97797 [Trametes elegans]